MLHRGPRPPLAWWMKCFTAWGPLSYVRLGLDILQAADLRFVVHHLVHWLAAYLWPWPLPGPPLSSATASSYRWTDPF